MTKTTTLRIYTEEAGEREDMTDKKKKHITGAALAAVIAVAAALLVELFANMRLLTMPKEQKGVQELSVVETVFSLEDILEGKPEEGLIYRSHDEYEAYEGRRCYRMKAEGYTDKLVIDYSNASAAYFDVLVTYENRFGYIESCVVKDANPIYLSTSTVNIRKNALEIWVIPVENSTPECENDPVVHAVYVRNAAQFIHFRFLFVLLCVLCAGLLIVLRDIIAEKFEYGFLIIALCSGLIFCLAMPLSRVVWDEESHMRGVYWLDITGSYEYNSFLQGYIDGSYENLPFEYSMSYEEYKDVYRRVNELSTPSPEDPAVSHPWGTSGFATFSYVIMAVTCNICKLAHAPFGLTYILVRLTNLFMYIAVIFFAVRKLPRGKMLMSAIALLPTPMFLASTISYDTIVTAFLYLGMAYLFYMMLGDREATWWEYLVFIGGMAYGSSRKAIYIPLILLGMFLPHRCFKNKKTERIMKAGIIVVFLALMSTFVLPALISPSQEGDLRGGTTSHAGQISSILGNPLGYAGLLLSTMWNYLWEFGIGTITLDHLAYLGSGTLTYVIVIYLVTLTLTSENTVYVQNAKRRWVPKSLTPWFKLILAALVFVVLCLIWTSMYLSYTEVGKTVMAGVQGRYYIPLLFPVLFSLSFNKVSTGWDKKKYSLVCSLISAFIIFYSIWEILLVKCSF